MSLCAILCTMRSDRSRAVRTARRLAALVFALGLAASAVALKVDEPVDAQPRTPTSTPTLGATPTPGGTAGPTQWWIYLPALQQSTLPMPTAPATPPTPAPTATPMNTLEPPPLRTPTPTIRPTDTPEASSTPTTTNTPPTSPTPDPTMEPTPEPTPTSVAAGLRIFTLECNGRDEYIRILNDGESALDLAGWSIHSVVGAETFTFPSYSLEPGDTVAVHSGPDAPPTGGSNFRWTTEFVWVGTGDEAQLKDPAGTVVDNAGC